MAKPVFVQSGDVLIYPVNEDFSRESVDWISGRMMVAMPGVTVLLGPAGPTVPIVYRPQPETDGTSDVDVERTARRAYRSFSDNESVDKRDWDSQPEETRERWRWIARAVLGV